MRGASSSTPDSESSLSLLLVVFSRTYFLGLFLVGVVLGPLTWGAGGLDALDSCLVFVLLSCWASPSCCFAVNWIFTTLLAPLVTPNLSTLSFISSRTVMDLAFLLLFIASSSSWCSSLSEMWISRFIVLVFCMPNSFCSTMSPPLLIKVSLTSSSKTSWNILYTYWT